MRTKLKHFITHIVLLIAMILTLLFAPVAMAQHYNATDGYVTETSTTNSAASEVVFAGSPTKSIRLLSVLAQSATNAAYINIFAGETPFTVSGVINVTNLTVATTAGIVLGRPCILQFGGTNWTATVLSTNGNTNVVLAGGSTLGFTPLTNSTFWHCKPPYRDLIGIATRQMAGDALYSAAVRAPLAVQVTPAVVASNQLAATVYYGTAGSP